MQERHSLYLKARERQAGDFALASVAISLTVERTLDGDSIRQMPVVLGGVAPVPYRARRVQEYLRGRLVSAVDPIYAAGLALPGATPMAGNGHKVTIATNLVKQAIVQLLENSTRGG